MKLTREARKDLALTVIAFGVLVLSIVRWWANNALLGLVILVQNLIALRIWHRRKNLLCFATTAVIGTLAELAFVASGAWAYANPTVLGLPFWFPLSFGQAGLLAYETVDLLAGRSTHLTV